MSSSSGARGVRPTDLVALVSFEGKVYPNEAVSWERLAKGEPDPHPLENAFEQWFSFATGRNTWINVKGQSIHGMLSTRKRGGGLAWEVDCLIHADEDPAVLASLAGRMQADAARTGARRVFLRLRDDAQTVDAIRAAGFVATRRETLWGSGEPPVPRVADPPLREREKGDVPGLFSLYTASVPQGIRGLEAATSEEWHAFQETRGFSRKSHEFVLEEDGRITGSVRTARERSVGWMEVTCRPESRWLDALVAAGLRRIGGRRSVFVPVPDFAPALSEVLANAGFQPFGSAVTLVKRIAIPVTEAETAPAARPVIAN